jgi:hypothetical protein
MAHIPNID